MGTGGLPARRPDQKTAYPPPTQAPGAAAGVTRTRIVEIIGGTGSGIFVYSGAPAAGNLIASFVGATTADPFGNSVIPDGMTIYNGTQRLFLGQVGASNLLQFATGASFENGPFQLQGLASGSGGTAFMQGAILGPANTAVEDRVLMTFTSGDEAGGTEASGAFFYFNGFSNVGVASWSGQGFDILSGSINGITPDTFALGSPGLSAGNPPSGSGTASASTVAGALNSYFVALASTYNNTVNCLNDVVSGFTFWGV